MKGNMSLKFCEVLYDTFVSNVRLYYSVKYNLLYCKVYCTILQDILHYIVGYTALYCRIYCTMLQDILHSTVSYGELYTFFITVSYIALYCTSYSLCAVLYCKLYCTLAVVYIVFLTIYLVSTGVSLTYRISTQEQPSGT